MAKKCTRKWIPSNEGKSLLGGLNLPACKLSTECGAVMLVSELHDHKHPIDYARTVTDPQSLLKNKGK